MPGLYAAVALLLCRRFIRAVGYRGPRPMLAVGGVIGIALGLDVLLGLVLRSWVANHTVALGASPGRTIAAVALVQAFLAAGWALSLAESVRLHGSRLRRMLLGLPLTTREASLLARLPALAAVGLVMLLVLVVTVAVVPAGALGVGYAAAAAASAMLAGTGVAAVAIIAARLTMRGARWAQVRLPCTLVLLMALDFAEIWALRELFTRSHLGWIGHVLVGPWIASEVQSHGSLPLPLALTCDVIGLAGFTALFLVTIEVREDGNGRELWAWKHRWPAPLVTLELTRLTRSGDVIANTVAVAVVILLLCATQARLPPLLRLEIASATVSSIAVLAAIPMLMVRSRSRLRRPLQLLLGLRVPDWTGSLVGAGGLVSGALLFPGCAALLASGTPWRTLVDGVPFALMAFGVAAGIGWALPADGDNPIGQIAGGAVLMGVSGAVWAWALMMGYGGLEWAAALVTIGAVGIASAFVTERWRQGRESFWRPWDLAGQRGEQV